MTASLVPKGISMNWTEAAVIPGAFDPLNGLGFYQITIFPEDGDFIFGANEIKCPPHLIPNIEADFGPNDYGTPLSELDDGHYQILVMSFSEAPKDSAGHSLEAHVDCSKVEMWFFKIDDGTVVDLHKWSP